MSEHSESSNSETIEQTAEYFCDSGLGIIHISDGRGNNLNFESLRSLCNALEQGIGDVDAKILMLRSGEDSFCLGMDLGGLEKDLKNDKTREADTRSNKEGEADTRTRAVALYSELLYTIMTCPKPVIALVEGAVKAGGVGISSACDIVIANEHASVELSEVLFGLVPFNVLPYLFDYRCTRQRFRYLVLSAALRTAEEAKQDGLIDEVYPQAELEKRLRVVIKKMMRAEPEALARTKRYCSELMGEEFQERRAGARSAVLSLMESAQVMEGIESFSAGTTPAWFKRFKPVNALSGLSGAGGQ